MLEITCNGLICRTSLTATTGFCGLIKSVLTAAAATKIFSWFMSVL